MKRNTRQNMRSLTLLLATVLWLPIPLQAQSSADTGQAASAPATPETTEGAALFESRCALCHRGSGPGVFMLERRVGKELAVLEERDNLTEAFLQAVVRNGIGSMPRFSRGELTDAELAAVARYLDVRGGSAE